MLFTPTEPADINSPEVAKTPGGGSGQGKDENVVNGHKEGDANPFAEYMWMENEEEYDRQVCTLAKTHKLSSCSGWVFQYDRCVSVQYSSVNSFTFFGAFGVLWLLKCQM